ncbi:MAG TPA: carboxypeptidase-like regulatory domain-containing protein [Pyrinomonadaceae bacterium]|nr:carboxypeptidase-like regulatory domain-containing protein [Pyrinomonadaceae bacterium]
MRFSARYLPPVLLTILSLSTLLWAQTPVRQSAKAPRASVSGRVTIKEKGAAGVVVALRKSDYLNPSEPFQSAKTDQDGYYRIANVAPGSYEISPSAPSYVPADTNQPNRKSVLITEDENVENINFSLVRGGVITGRVTDADGRPVIQQGVFFYRAEAFERQQQTPSQPVFVTTSAQTDDRGIYRAFGLAAGRYKVASGLSDDIYNASFVGARSSYKHVFHPDVSDQAKATVIEVVEGTEAANVDITLGRAMQTFSVAGRVVDGEKGSPIPNIRLGLRRTVGRRLDFAGTSTTTNSQGDFVVEGLIPGKYGFFLFQNQSGPMRLESVTFDIIDQDLTGLTVKFVQGGSVSGVVVLETENKTVQAKLSTLQLQAYVSNADGSPPGSSTSSRIAPDGSFLLSGLPAGRVNMMIGSNTPFPLMGFNIARIERDGVATPQGMEIKDGEQLTGVRVVVVYGSATLRGVVNIENGTLPEGGRIFIRLVKLGENASNMRPPQVDARGRFLAEGIQPGTYEVQASVALPRTLGRTVKREIILQDGVTTDITLTIDMSAPLPTPPPRP